jgi:hypothetical protein
MRALRRLAVTTVLAALGVVTAAPVAYAAEVDLFARLGGSAAFPNATGHSEYERTAIAREVEVTVTHIAKLAGKRVTVFVNGKKVGTMLVSSTGRAHREWDTERGQFVPFASAGDPIKVRKADGTLVARGIYRRETDD